MRCQALNCRKTKDVQFIYVRRSRKPMTLRKEFYCPRHLRFRAAELELMRLAGKFRKEIIGWT